MGRNKAKELKKVVGLRVYPSKVKGLKISLQKRLDWVIKIKDSEWSDMLDYLEKLRNK